MLDLLRVEGFHFCDLHIGFFEQSQLLRCLLLVDLDANVVEVELQLRKVMEVALPVLELHVVLREREEPSLLEGLLVLALQHSKDQLRVARHKDYHLHLLEKTLRESGGPSGAGCGRECFNAAASGRGGCTGVVGVAVGRPSEGGDWTGPVVPIIGGGASPR